MKKAYPAAPRLAVGSAVFDRTYPCASSSVLTLTPQSVEVRLMRHYPGGNATRCWFTRSAFAARFSLLPLSTAAGPG